MSNDGPNGPNMNKRRVRRPCHGVGGGAQAHVHHAPFFASNGYPHVSICNLLLSGRGRSIAARRAIDGVRFFAHLSEEPMSESRRCPPFTEMGGGGPVNGHHAVSRRMVTYAKKEFDKQS